jgi:hypothetical protein
VFGEAFAEEAFSGEAAGAFEEMVASGLVGELTAHVRTSFLRVGRTGPNTRFLPVKTPEDLTAIHGEIVALYGA